jgi:hypothetical protein
MRQGSLWFPVPDGSPFSFFLYRITKAMSNEGRMTVSLSQIRRLRNTKEQHHKATAQTMEPDH